MYLSLVKRYRMYKFMKRLKKELLRSGYVNGADWCKTYEDLEIVRALESIGAIKCDYTMSSRFPALILEGKQTYLYTINRSELWLNRIASFVLGVISTLLIGWIKSKLGF